MGHGKCNCGEAQRMNVTRRVRVFDSHGRAAQDATVTEEVRVDVRGEPHGRADYLWLYL